MNNSRPQTPSISAEIFISYARADRDRVLPLVERLREAGVTYWLDEGNIQGATLWGKEIVEQEEEAFNGMLGALHTIGVAINENIEIKPP